MKMALNITSSMQYISAAVIQLHFLGYFDVIANKNDSEFQKYLDDSLVSSSYLHEPWKNAKGASEGGSQAAGIGN